MGDRSNRKRSNRGRSHRKRSGRLPGITPEYLRQIEEGEVLPSPEVIDRLADVYQLGDLARRHLHDLYSSEVDGPAPVPDIVVTNEHRRRVDDHSPHPAALLDHRWNVLHANAGYRRVLPGIGAGENNLLAWMFLDDRARSIVIDHTAEARKLVGRFKLTYGTFLGDPEFEDILRRCESDEFFDAAWSDFRALTDSPGPTPMNWRDPGTDRLLRVTEQRVPDSEWLTLHTATPIDQQL
ncbi:helix-turn-helix domain-containing protein [Nocardia sp. BMG51109]|uniref:MmyB family transcriptional regulator n=1 Tax=Nocardia sp. BMG51109 TaxID=1056816 RepID=UPI000464509D|nr:helix-turn-helix domain-containing protein [Nocardia sp. BMG51109]